MKENVSDNIHDFDVNRNDGKRKKNKLKLKQFFGRKVRDKFLLLWHSARECEFSFATTTTGFTGWRFEPFLKYRKRVSAHT